jgi:stringent starvation protein B
MSAPSDGSVLPPKRDVAMALIQTAASVYVHLDPRALAVRVPTSLKNQPQLVLQVGMNLAVAIPDLDIGEDALSCTLSFNRRPEFCWIPWTAIFGLVGDDGRGMIWPDSVPSEVATAAPGRATGGVKGKERHGLRVAGSAPEASSEGAPASSGEPSSASAAAPATRRLGSPSTATPAPVVAKQAGEKTGSKRELPAYLRVVK